MAGKDDANPDPQRAYWQGEIERAKKRFRGFWELGDGVVDAYRLQKADNTEASSKDKYNILYSSTETIRPNMYAQTPKTRVTLRNKDTASAAARMGALLIEGSVEYLKIEEDFDELMESCTEDFLLPGLGQGWVRYEARLDGDTMLDEMVKMEYVYWQDFLTGVARTWKEVPWVAKRVWLTKAAAIRRFGKAKANMLTYATRDNTGRESDNPSETAEAWEIWDKETRKVYWYAESATELLDVKDDPLKLKKFFPCPRPMRAISNTRTFVPRPLYSQYKSQAETLNLLTKRIRLLGEALRVVGLYDGTQVKLSDILNPAAGNRMIAVDSWAMFAQNGGIDGSVQWLPIDQIIKVLTELQKAREVCKAEIYEITGFSDIVRGVSKASETLGAQNLKANWAGARVKKMQKDVQRFARDLLALAGELVAEHCAPETIALFSGLEIPTGAQVQVDPAMMHKVQLFGEACKFIKDESRRVATVDIETDSTLMADDAIEREDRAKFLAASGAFLQQAVPAMEATPELGPLLGALLMFTARSFPSARVIEDEFVQVQAAMANRKPPEPDKDGKQAKTALDTKKLEQDAQHSQAELAQKQQSDAATHQREIQAEQNRHAERMLELEIRKGELEVSKRQAAVAEMGAITDRFKAYHDAGLKEQELGMDESAAAVEVQQAEQDRLHEADQADADRDAQAEAAQIAAEAAQEAPKPSGEGGGTPRAA